MWITNRKCQYRMLGYPGGFRVGPARGHRRRSLFAGPESRVRKYVSPELIEWFEAHPRLTRVSWFEAHPRPTRVSWFGSAAARHAHLAGRRIG